MLSQCFGSSPHTPTISNFPTTTSATQKTSFTSPSHPDIWYSTPSSPSTRSLCSRESSSPTCSSGTNRNVQPFCNRLLGFCSTFADISDWRLQLWFSSASSQFIQSFFKGHLQRLRWVSRKITKAFNIFIQMFWEKKQKLVRSIGGGTWYTSTTSVITMLVSGSAQSPLVIVSVLQCHLVLGSWYTALLHRSRFSYCSIFLVYQRTDTGYQWVFDQCSHYLHSIRSLWPTSRFHWKWVRIVIFPIKSVFVQKPWLVSFGCSSHALGQKFSVYNRTFRWIFPGDVHENKTEVPLDCSGFRMDSFFRNGNILSVRQLLLWFGQWVEVRENIVGSSSRCSLKRVWESNLLHFLKNRMVTFRVLDHSSYSLRMGRYD